MGAWDSFSVNRWKRTINLVLQAVLFLSLFGEFNYLALHHGWRFDLTRNRSHTLSEETKAYLRSLDQPVELIVTLDRNADDDNLAQAYRDISGLLQEYVNATAAKPSTNLGRVTVRHLDVYREQRLAEQLEIDRADVILALCNDRRQVIPLSAFYTVRDGLATAFTGEQAITSAILSVSNPERPHLYFLAGHGEMLPSDVSARGLSLLADELRLRNFAVETIDLSQTRGVPDDAAAVILAAPDSYSAFEVEQLRLYLSNRAGRAIILLRAGIEHGLDDLLYDWGLVADDVVVYDTDTNNVTEMGELRIAAFSPHPITQTLIDNSLPVFVGATRVVRPDPGRPLDNALRTEVLAATSETAWGERNYRARTMPVYDPGFDLKGLAGFEPRNRLSVITSSERVTPPEGLPFSVRGGRVVLFGNADFASNGRIYAPGNQNIILNAIDWCVDRDIQLNTIPRPIERFQLNLSQTELVKLRYSLLLILPGAAALFGLIVYWTRRS